MTFAEYRAGANGSSRPVTALTGSRPQVKPPDTHPGSREPDSSQSTPAQPDNVLPQTNAYWANTASGRQPKQGKSVHRPPNPDIAMPRMNARWAIA